MRNAFRSAPSAAGSNCRICAPWYGIIPKFRGAVKRRLPSTAQRTFCPTNSLYNISPCNLNTGPKRQEPYCFVKLELFSRWLGNFERDLGDDDGLRIFGQPIQRLLPTRRRRLTGGGRVRRHARRRRQGK